MEKVSPPNDRVSILTQQYRLDVLSQAADHEHHCPESASWHVAQQVLNHLDQEADDSTKSSRVVHVCQDCGAVLQPGYKGTTLSVQRSSSLTSTQRRTLKRRRQRQLKRQAFLKQQAAKKVQSLQKEEPTVACSVAILKENPKDSLVLDRHHLVVACGVCRSKVRLKGLKRQRPAKAAMVEKRVYNKSVPKKTAAALPSNNLEFVPLPILPTPTLLQQQLGKQKKKKKNPPPTKKGKMMDFLSSLND
jgi:ferredoxin-like protein FixX